MRDGVAHCSIIILVAGSDPYLVMAAYAAEFEEEGVEEYAEYAAAARKSHQLHYSLSALRKDFPDHEFSKDCSITNVGREGGEADNRAGVKVNHDSSWCYQLPDSVIYTQQKDHQNQCTTLKKSIKD